MEDIKQLSKIISTAKMLGKVMETTPSEDNKSTEQSFDSRLQSPAIRSIKAAIPYLDYKYQRSIGIAVKLMEMDRLLNHYTVLSTESGKDNAKRMLMAVKEELPKETGFAADLLVKIIEIRDILSSMPREEFN